MTLEPQDLDDLKKAKSLLEHPSITAKITNILGTPIEKGFDLLPDNWGSKVAEVTEVALKKSINAAIFTLKNKPGASHSNTLHKVAVATTGGVGGFFGLAALAIELPISTTIMLRSIADIARSEGESISQPESQLACLEVFALGGPSKSDDGADSGYFAVRAALAQSISHATGFIAEKGLSEKGTPALLRFIVQVAERFSIQVTEKAAAQAIPAIGAAGGALINTLFIDHFQDIARGHFMVRRLEKKYGKPLIQSTYQSITL